MAFRLKIKLGFLNTGSVNSCSKWRGRFDYGQVGYKLRQAIGITWVRTTYQQSVREFAIHRRQPVQHVFKRAIRNKKLRARSGGAVPALNAQGWIEHLLHCGGL